MMSVLFVGNQGGRSVLEIYSAMASTLVHGYGCRIGMSVWLENECAIPASLGVQESSVVSFEGWEQKHRSISDADVEKLVQDYREVNWSEVVAAERAFTDYSMLLGAAGDRRETSAYIERLVVNMVRFFESEMAGHEAIVCQTADTLFSLVAFKVAHHLGIRAFALAPAWLLEPGNGGGFFANSEFLECSRMRDAFVARTGTPLTVQERARTDVLVASIRGYDGKTPYHAKTSKGKSAGRNALTPNMARLLSYLSENSRKDKNVEYIRFDPWRKLSANILRVVRKQMTRSAFGPTTSDAIPLRSVFYAIHYQPEQSTLAQGIWHVNQIALVENISKSLPLGYTLVVKEHPWGRGNRPAWQYRHLAGLYNVMFCDAPAKEIIQRVDAVVAVSGTVAMESMVFDKPTVMLGRNFFEYSDLLYRVRDIQDLPETLAKILVDGHYTAQRDRDERLHRFLMSYLDGLIPYFPLPEFMSHWADALAMEIGLIDAKVNTQVGVHL